MSRPEWFLFIVLPVFIAGGLPVLIEWLRLAKPRPPWVKVVTSIYGGIVFVLILVGLLVPFTEVVETYTLKGNIYDQNSGKGIANASVELIDSLRKDAPPQHKFSGPGGKFHFENLESSLYTLTARKPPEYKENAVSVLVPKDKQISIPLPPVVGGTISPTPLSPAAVPPAAETLSKFDVTFHVTDAKIAELDTPNYKKQIVLLTGELRNDSQYPVLLDLERSSVVALAPDRVPLGTPLQFDPIASSYLADRFIGMTIKLDPGAPPIKGTIAFSSSQALAFPAGLTFVNPQLVFLRQPSFFWEPDTFQLYEPFPFEW